MPEVSESEIPWGEGVLSGCLCHKKNKDNAGSFDDTEGIQFKGPSFLKNKASFLVVGAEELALKLRAFVALATAPMYMVPYKHL